MGYTDNFSAFIGTPVATLRERLRRTIRKNPPNALARPSAVFD
ncbi:hypothetical protein [Nostoc sp. T09]|nr:hypothetical protein [Nostoc sp. T09]